MHAARSAITAAMLVIVALTVAPALGSAALAVPALQSLRAGIGVTSQGGQPTLSITGRLPDSASLPATIVIPFPNGLTPSWVGEIAGSDPSKDPTAKYTIAPGPKFSTMTITVTQNRIGQAEFDVQTPVANGGTQYAADLPILGKVGEVTLEIRVPTGSKVASISPGIALSTTSGPVDIYSITKKSPRTGSTFSGALVVGAVAPAASTPVGSAAGSSSESTALIVIALSAIAGFVGVYLFQRAKENRVAAAASEDVSIDAPAPAHDRAPTRESHTLSKKAAKRAARERAESAARDARSLDAASGAGEAFGDDEETEPHPEPRPEPVIVTPRPANRFADEPEDSTGAGASESDAGAPGPSASVRLPGMPAAGIVGQIKELAVLRSTGTLDAQEFSAAKQSLLAGEARVVALLGELARFERDSLLTSEEFTLAKEQLLTGSAEMIVGIEELAELEVQGLLSRDEFRTVVDRLLQA